MTGVLPRRSLGVSAIRCRIAAGSVLRPARSLPCQAPSGSLDQGGRPAGRGAYGVEVPRRGCLCGGELVSLPSDASAWCRRLCGAPLAPRRWRAVTGLRPVFARQGREPGSGVARMPSRPVLPAAEGACGAPRVRRAVRVGFLPYGQISGVVELRSIPVCSLSCGVHRFSALSVPRSRMVTGIGHRSWADASVWRYRLLGLITLVDTIQGSLLPLGCLFSMQEPCNVVLFASSGVSWNRGE